MFLPAVFISERNFLVGFGRLRVARRSLCLLFRLFRFRRCTVFCLFRASVGESVSFKKHGILRFLLSGILVRPLCEAERTFDKDFPPLTCVFAERFGVFAESVNVDEKRIFFPFARRVFVFAGNCKPEASAGIPAKFFKLGMRRRVPDEDDFIVAHILFFLGEVFLFDRFAVLCNVAFATVFPVIPVIGATLHRKLVIPRQLAFAVSAVLALRFVILGAGIPPRNPQIVFYEVVPHSRAFPA